MSMPFSDKITCPKCGQESEFQMWRSINVSLDPEMKRKIVDQSAFDFACPHCGVHTKVVYPFLYHDMGVHMMMYFVSEEEVEKTYNLFRGEDDKFKNLFAGMDEEKYVYRIVTDLNSVREKIMIFDEGYDDRVIELMKIFLQQHMQNQNPEFKTEAIYFDSCMDNNEGTGFVLLSEDGQFASVSFVEEIYDSFKELIDKNRPAIHEDDLIIDFEWAAGAL